jgi:hypothetical protein
LPDPFWPIRIVTPELRAKPSSTSWATTGRV